MKEVLRIIVEISVMAFRKVKYQALISFSQDQLWDFSRIESFEHPALKMPTQLGVCCMAWSSIQFISLF